MKIRQFHFFLFFFLILLLACNNFTKGDEVKTKKESIATTANKRQLRHVVLFKFKEGISQEKIEEAEKAFISLPGKISQIKNIEWGKNNSPEGLNKGFTHCFFLTFDNEKDRAVYLPHPDHKAFGEMLAPILADVLVLDYWTSE
jgi:hypothetical protein